MKDYLYSAEPYLIAETAYTFEGDKDYLLRQTRSLPENINAIKYHLLFNIDEYMVKDHPVHSGLENWLLTEEEWLEILENARDNNLEVIILADDQSTVEFCAKNHRYIDAVEIHAACINDLKLLDKAIEFSQKYNKVFILGISGFEVQELFDIIQYLEEKELENVLLIYGFQNFPTDIKEIGLKKIPLLNEMLGYRVGYADHTLFNDPVKEHIIYTAYSLGANIQEVHYVLKEGEERTDYITAKDAESLAGIKENLTLISKSIGSVDFRLNTGEKEYLNFRKVPVYISDFKEGHLLKKEDIIFKRVETPARQHKFKEENMYVGKRLIANVSAETEVRLEHLV